MRHDKRLVRNAFASIAPRYDLLNTLLSLGIDTRWRKRTMLRLAPGIGEQVLDLCAGTLTVSRDILKKSNSRARITSIDFCLEMLDLGQRRLKPDETAAIRPVCGDAEALPARSGSFDAAVVTYGVRNLGDLEAGLKELFRILRPGGRLVILEFLKPRMPGFAGLYRFYLRHLLPRIGGLISGSQAAYRHLSDSIEGFIDEQELCTRLEAAGFDRIRMERLTLGIAGVFQANKP